MYLIDTHAHLDFPRFDKDRNEVIKRAKDTDLKYIINVGADLTSSQRSVELAQNQEEIFAAVGVHPHEADTVNEQTLQQLKKLAAKEKVVAIGETGLDFYYDNSPRDLQKQAFREQLRLAREMGLPVIVHAREANRETIKILQEENANKIGGILHCFAGDIQMAEAALNMGFYLAFGGIITFNSAGELRDIVAEVPLDRLLLETDCPYLTPVPHRGQRNEPSYVQHVALKIASIKKVPLEEIAEKTTNNALKVYNLAN